MVPLPQFGFARGGRPDPPRGGLQDIVRLGSTGQATAAARGDKRARVVLFVNGGPDRRSGFYQG